MARDSGDARRAGDSYLPGRPAADSGDWGSPRASESARATRLSPQVALGLAVGLGLIGGYLDLGGLLLKTDVARAALYHHLGRFYPWAVPVADGTLVLVPGLVLAAVCWLRPGAISPRVGAWLLATVALWLGLLRMPFHPAASLVLAAGFGRGISRAVAALVVRRPRWARAGVVGLAGVLGVLAVLSSGRRAWEEARAWAHLPPPQGSGNVIVIILDAVRAANLSLHGYARDTAPHLVRWARRGVKFEQAIAPAPWTFPSHSSFFTGQWPYKLSAHWQLALDASYPTLAGFLAAKGYETIAWVGNTSFCSYETGLDRGFARFEDYPLTLESVLCTSTLGRWLVRHVLHRGEYALQKWIQIQARDARRINRAFLDWLDRRRDPSRPFFAFVNYFDAHEPFVIPEGQGRFGLRPESARDYEMLLGYHNWDKRTFSPRDVTLARDAYDDCIAYLDRQVGTLLDALERRGTLKNTTVIIASDHGEEFAEHGVYDHGYTLYMNAVHVPLLIISPAAPSGRVVAEPVSLRDLPATVADLTGLAADAPFPGRSLADHWRVGEGHPRSSRPATPRPEGRSFSPALSEVAIPEVLNPLHVHESGSKQRGLTMALVAEGRHYLRDIQGQEELYDLASDPQEQRNLKDPSAGGAAAEVGQFRRTLLQILTDDPVKTGLATVFVAQFRRRLETAVHGAPRSPRFAAK
jgi:arylsulfatase A-like enzyme